MNALLLVLASALPVEAPRYGDVRIASWAWWDPWRGDHEVLTPKGWQVEWREDGPVNGRVPVSIS